MVREIRRDAPQVQCTGGDGDRTLLSIERYEKPRNSSIRLHSTCITFYATLDSIELTLNR